MMLTEDTKTLESNQYQKSGKKLSIFYGDVESLIKKRMDVKVILTNHLQ